MFKLMKIMQVTMEFSLRVEILKKDRRFFLTLNSRFPWLMGLFGHNSLDFDAPSLGRSPQSTLWPWHVKGSCSSENTWTKNLPSHRGVRESGSAVKATHAHIIRCVLQSYCLSDSAIIVTQSVLL